jgi:NAD(P)-dependent dehydrogenase (short-subunit alcohol dehydrogenase family)
MKALVFGASGSLGAEICLELESQGFEVIRASRSKTQGFHISLGDKNWAENAASLGTFDAVIWAQGINSAGTVLDTTSQEILNSFEANVLSITETLRALELAKALSTPSRGVVLSSIWQEHGRGNKLAYMVSKSAISGLIKSVAIDMAENGFSINAILPGVIDTPMTRSMLSPEQIENIKSNSLGGRLVNAQEVAKTAVWLASSSSSGINAQFITVDKGWTVKRSV